MMSPPPSPPPRPSSTEVEGLKILNYTRESSNSQWGTEQSFYLKFMQNPFCFPLQSPRTVELFMSLQQKHSAHMFLSMLRELHQHLRRTKKHITQEALSQPVFLASANEQGNPIAWYPGHPSNIFESTKQAKATDTRFLEPLEQIKTEDSHHDDANVEQHPVQDRVALPVNATSLVLPHPQAHSTSAAVPETATNLVLPHHQAHSTTGSVALPVTATNLVLPHLQVRSQETCSAKSMNIVTSKPPTPQVELENQEKDCANSADEPHFAIPHRRMHSLEDRKRLEAKVANILRRNKRHTLLKCRESSRFVEESETEIHPTLNQSLKKLEGILDKNTIENLFRFARSTTKASASTHACTSAGMHSRCRGSNDDGAGVPLYTFRNDPEEVDSSSRGGGIRPLRRNRLHCHPYFMKKKHIGVRAQYDSFLLNTVGSCCVGWSTNVSSL